MKRVEGKVAIVTGGVLGIGRATSLLLAKEGAKGHQLKAGHLIYNKACPRTKKLVPPLAGFSSVQ